LSELGVARDDFDHPKVYKSLQADGYVRFFQQQHPLYSSQTAAMLGGWHVGWPDDGSYYNNGRQVTLLTLRDSEPWIEVWPREGKYEALWRST
jgi:hypothetical protein